MRIEPNRALFQKLCCDFITGEQERFNIGTYKEKKLHIIMKTYFEENTDFHEVPFNGYIADIKNDLEIIEIQTTGFSRMNEKLSAYLPECRVKLVYPVPYKKNVAWIDPETGDISAKRRSPKKKGLYDVVFEMVRITEHICNPNLTIVAVLLDTDEYRMLNGWSSDRKRGSERYEMIPNDICEIVEFATNADFLELIPPSCVKDFTSADFVKASGVSSRYVYGVLKVFEVKGLIKRTGKRGRVNLYSRTDQAVYETSLN